MRFGSVCSGIEAASVAWHPLGWRASFLSEIEAFPRSVLSHHYPETPLHGDFTTIKAGEYEPIDLLVGGTPCQSFSVAGLRGGLDDDRGNLALEYLRLADRLRPRWLVWENVPGVLSSNGGRDFGAILGGMVELGYGVAYRVLDAQFFGVAQRRRRVFVVGYLGDWRRAAAVLFERHSLSGNPAPRRETGKRPTPSVAGCLATGGAGRAYPGTSAQDAGESYLVPITFEISPCLRAKANNSHRSDTQAYIPVVARSLTARYDGSPCDDRGPDIVAFEWQRGATQNLEISQNFSPALIKSQTPAICFDTTQVTSPTNRSNPQPGDPCHTLAKGSHAPAIAFQPGNLRRGAGAPPSECVFPTLKSDHGRGLSDQHPHVAVAFADCFNGKVTGDTAPTMGTRGSSVNSSGPTLLQASAVRRLTPRECERLQGFPDDYSLVPHRGKPAADGPRYKALGNSMAVPVMAYIGQRIAAVEALPINLAVTA